MDLTVLNADGPLLLDFTFADTSTTSFHWSGLLGHESPLAALPEDFGGQTGGHILQFTVEEPIQPAATPFFWDEFNRSEFDTDRLDWGNNSAADVVLEDGSAILTPTSDNFPGFFNSHESVEDFKVRAQLRFLGDFPPGINPWIGIWARDPVVGTGSEDGGYWGGVAGDGILYLGKTPRGTADASIREQTQLFTPAEVRENDIHYELEAIGETITITAWLDGEEKPDEPQLTMSDSDFRFGVVSGIFENPSPELTGFAIRSFALLPGLDGDFDASKELGVADINLLTQEILAGGENRALDLTGDALVDEADRVAWVERLAATSFGDADLNGSVDFADFLTLSSNFGQAGTWELGDFNGNGQVDFADFLLLSDSFGQLAVTAIPEPQAVVMMLSAICGTCSIRRRRRDTRFTIRAA